MANDCITQARNIPFTAENSHSRAEDQFSISQFAVALGQLKSLRWAGLTYSLCFKELCFQKPPSRELEQTAAERRPRSHWPQCFCSHLPTFRAVCWIIPSHFQLGPSSFNNNTHSPGFASSPSFTSDHCTSRLLFPFMYLHKKINSP